MNGKQNLYYVPIEPLDERYTGQWYTEFLIAFKKAGFNTITIDGSILSTHVDVGTFLPMNSTVHYKNTQLQRIAKLFQDHEIKNNDIFFIADLEFWGIESIRLMAQMNNIKVFIFAFLHAASYTKEDAFEIATPYQKYTELGWLSMCDLVFVGSEYHKQAVIERRIRPYASKEDFEGLVEKIKVTGNPIFMDQYKLPAMPPKKKQIIISNRFDWEKRPNISLDFAYILKKRNPDLSIVVTTSRPVFKSNKKWLSDMAIEMEHDGIISIMDGLSKQAYHKVLAESKVMLTNSIEENFGYCIAEALLFNTYPVAKNELSHPELCNYDTRLLFNDEDEIIEKVEYLLDSKFEVKDYITKYQYALTFMVSHMTRIRAEKELTKNATFTI
jgi:glycosyltransferase involved in cell wall biosynthesis